MFAPAKLNESAAPKSCTATPLTPLVGSNDRYRFIMPLRKPRRVKSGYSSWLTLLLILPYNRISLSPWPR